MFGFLLAGWTCEDFTSSPLLDYIEMVDFPSRLQESGNVLLMKDEVGRSKPSARALPGPNFVYGKVEAKDKEGVYERKF